jgi:hypothetical protein
MSFDGKAGTIGGLETIPTLPLLLKRRDCGGVPWRQPAAKRYFPKKRKE